MSELEKQAKAWRESRECAALEVSDLLMAAYIAGYRAATGDAAKLATDSYEGEGHAGKDLWVYGVELSAAILKLGEA